MRASERVVGMPRACIAETKFGSVQVMYVDESEQTFAAKVFANRAAHNGEAIRTTRERRPAGAFQLKFVRRSWIIRMWRLN